ncbi:MAG: LysM peptidoglycan-binding domain-containing protein [Oscillospiraceae bacterium]|nr:LysM peptidoglycan-binding domain-containing protein [Lawsonibacter sp.]MCI6397871.1 LysM peptidoglycan-binding domain-containing protein [Lawsonibacter sp.]MDU2196063.1 LysM peptidoglycan-binding domain-containing protein [Clostridiales bacterium]MDY2978306.1 LysM peptidoglycan-binding domain-containing protein [Oscillospiraceae bacterium]
MKLAAMRYKDYVWPHNPRVYTIEYERRMGARKVPFGRYFLQDLGPAQRVMRGEGEFVGEEAYAEFKRLASVFYDDGPGLLVHPVWQTANAYFVELSLAQEPRADYVRYTFAFWEGYEGHNTTLRTQQGESAGSGASGTESRSGAVWHTVAQGETMWGIARRYGLTLTALVTLNPQIKNPNLILVGEKVRVA